MKRLLHLVAMAVMAATMLAPARAFVDDDEKIEHQAKKTGKEEAKADKEALKAAKADAKAEKEREKLAKKEAKENRKIVKAEEKGYEKELKD